MGADLVGDIKVEVYAAFVSDSRKVEHTVCGAAESHIHCKSIAECSLCHDVTGSDVLFEQFHDLHAGVFCKLDPLRIYCGDSTVASESHTEYLCKAVHGVCGIHT